MNASRVLTVILLIGGLAVASLAVCQAAAPTYPTKAIEFVVHASPGGGGDVFARQISNIMTKEKIVPVAMPVVNKTGGGGAVAYTYVNGKKGDPYVIAHVSPVFLTTPLSGRSPVTYKDFTPIVRLIYDEEVILVKYDSPYKTLQDLIEAAKKNPKGIKQGGGSIGGSDTMISHNIEKAAGVKFNFISYPSGGDGLIAMLGGHVDFVVGEPAEALAQAEAKKVRLLAVDAEKRLPGLPDVPSLYELGVNADFKQWRGVVAPKDIPEEARVYLENAFEKMSKTEAWQAFMKRMQVTPAFARGAEFLKQLEKDNVDYVEPLKSQGLIKAK